MKNFFVNITFITVLSVLVCLSSTNAQNQKRVAASLKASVSQTIGADTEIKIVYSRPGVKGRTIWGELVPWAAPNAEGKIIPWRAGANENTTIEFSKDILVNGKKIAAGKYSIHILTSKDEWTIILNKKNNSWGSYDYNEAEDALRIKVTPNEAPFTEWLTYGFDELAGTSALAFLQWEKLKVSFTIAVSE